MNARQSPDPGADRYRGLETLTAHLAARRQVLFARFEREHPASPWLSGVRRHAIERLICQLVAY